MVNTKLVWLRGMCINVREDKEDIPGLIARMTKGNDGQLCQIGGRAWRRCSYTHDYSGKKDPR